MARTPLFAALQRALIGAGADFGPRALSRRRFLAMSAASALLPAACARPAGDIAVVGAGAAGLTVAYRLQQAGRRVTLYEASDRFGGRMFTRRGFNADGQFCELGGELVDTNHEALRALAQELGVNVVRLTPETEAAEDIYQIGDRTYTQRDMLNAEGRGAFAGLAHRIAEDQARLLDAEENWTDHARALDGASLRAYLASLGNRAPTWAMRLLDVAYHGEYGIPTDEQSALNLVDFIGTGDGGGFQIFGESDEAFRIEGGSSSLIDALAARLNSATTRQTRHALAAVARSENGVTLTFDEPSGRSARTHEHVVFALPFAKLRAVEGLDGLGLGEMTLRAIRELGYGDNAKLMVATRDRAWLAAPTPMNGALYSDAAQIVWETSRGQSGARGVLTNFLTGQRDRDAALEAMRRGLGRLSEQAAASLDPGVSAWMDWRRQPFALGSYAGAKVGQYTTLLEAAASPSADGRIHFAGEHTSVDFLGFMNGAVESGERAAAALLA